ncbi:VTT domain-containing protein [Planococcus sp. APC 4015]|nr:VTT domain-containing protein [Planococcus sp. APC 4015]
MSEQYSRPVGRRPVLRLILLGVFVAVAVSVGLLLPSLDVDDLRARFGELGVGGAVVFAVVYALITLSPVPKGILNIAAGVLWGFAAGSVIVYFGALLGAAAAFAIARALGRDGVLHLLGARARRVDDLFERRGFLAILGLRLVPVVPFTGLNYASGLTGVPFAGYGAATAIGIIPGTMAYVALGAFGIEAGPLFWVALGVLGVLSLAGAVVGLTMRRRRAASDSSARSEHPVDGPDRSEGGDDA